MKRFFIVIIFLLFATVSAETIKAGITKEYIPEGFFGSWGVISKLSSSNNPTIFNMESRDVWMLSGYGNVLVLQNLQSGARSEILIKEKTKDGKTLKFEREKTSKDGNKKVVYKEKIEFILMGNMFSGSDIYTVEQYDAKNVQIKKDTATYNISGVKISGSTPNE